MSFSEREHSIAAGQPVRLYRFSRGVLRWLYNSSDRDITVGSEIYRALQGGIIDDGVRRTGETSSDEITLTAPADIDVAQLYRSAPPSAEVGLQIFDYQHQESDVVGAFTGTILYVRWPQLDRCEICCQALTASLDVPGLRLTWDRNCGAALFDLRCGVNRDLWSVEISIQFITSATLTSADAAAYPDGWFDGGFIEWSIGGGETDRRAIETHRGSELQLMEGTSGISLGAATAYPGCGRTAQQCKDKYSNLDNFRGDPNLMGTNPFDGNPVF
jgi:uncharacterized phage protein (TIGR02218 family)